MDKSPPFAKSAKGRPPSSLLILGIRAMGEEDARTLLIAEGVDGVELGGTRSRIEASTEADKNRKEQRKNHEPPRHRRKFDGIEALSLEIEVGSEGDCATE